MSKTNRTAALAKAWNRARLSDAASLRQIRNLRKAYFRSVDVDRRRSNRAELALAKARTDAAMQAFADAIAALRTVR